MCFGPFRCTSVGFSVINGCEACFSLLGNPVWYDVTSRFALPIVYWRRPGEPVTDLVIWIYSECFLYSDLGPSDSSRSLPFCCDPLSFLNPFVAKFLSMSFGICELPARLSLCIWLACSYKYGRGDSALVSC